MLTAKEITELLGAIVSNWLSLASGVLGIVLTIISIWWPSSPMKRIGLVLAFLGLLLGLAFAWRDEYRARQQDQMTWQRVKSDIEKQIQEKDRELKEKENEILTLRDIRSLQRLTLKPNAVVSFHHNDDGVGYLFSSRGPGPAVIRWFSVLVDGVPQPHWAAFANALGIKDPKFTFLMLYPDLQESANTQKVLFWMKKGEGAEIVFRNQRRVQIEMCYCALYGECWFFTDVVKETPQPNPTSCKAPPKVAFRTPTE